MGAGSKEGTSCPDLAMGKASPPRSLLPYCPGVWTSEQVGWGVLELAPTSALELTVKYSRISCAGCFTLGGLKSAMAGIFIPWVSAKALHQALRESCNSAPERAGRGGIGSLGSRQGRVSPELGWTL